MKIECARRCPPNLQSQITNQQFLAYLAGGSFGRVGDAGDLLRHGVPQWQLLAFGLATVPAGLLLWHGQGPNFGLGEARGTVDRRAAIAVAALLALLVAAELAWS